MGQVAASLASIMHRIDGEVRLRHVHETVPPAPEQVLERAPESDPSTSA